MSRDGGIKGHDGNPQGSAEVAAGDTFSAQEKMNTRPKSGKTAATREESPNTPGTI